MSLFHGKNNEFVPFPILENPSDASPVTDWPVFVLCLHGAFYFSTSSKNLCALLHLESGSLMELGPVFYVTSPSSGSLEGPFVCLFSTSHNIKDTEINSSTGHGLFIKCRLIYDPKEENQNS